MRDPTPEFFLLLEMLNIKSKRELIRHSKRMVVHQQDLVALILSARDGVLSPYRYANHFAGTVAENLHPSLAEREAIASNGIGEFKTRAARKFTSKIFQIFKERRTLAAHLLYTPNQNYWHLFYFDNRDIQEAKNHWKQGTHIHYVSDLWPDLSLDDVWEQVNSGKVAFANKLHLRYKPA
jgi:hypothetical protein